MNKIEIKNLHKRYPAFELYNVFFTVPKGYITGFIGKNGMGKTTTIKSILSLIHYDGQILIDGKDITTDFDNQNIGVITDSSFLAKDWHMTDVNRAMKAAYDRWDEEKFRKYLSDFQIDGKLKVKELSKGMYVKLMLAIALSHDADLLILDEPTSGLDPSMRDEFMGIIANYMKNENRTVLFSTHITQDLEAIADHIVFIDQGRVVLAKEKDDFMNYFMILKGSLEHLEKIDPACILGKKISQYSCELLMKRESFSKIPEGFIEDAVSIDRIMILFGRSK